MKLVILGLGLIGGSLAVAARQRLKAEVVGIDLGPVVGSQRAREITDRSIMTGDVESVRLALSQADLAVMATPVRAIIGGLGEVLQHARVVTDCGSTKRQVVQAACLSPRAGWLVPGHPMAGGAEGGLDHARGDLFEGRRWILCAEGREQGAVVQVERLVTGVGAEIIQMSPEEHDSAMAAVSHLPQLLASALELVGAKHTPERTSGPAYEAMTRTAGGELNIWLDIFATNGDEIAGALRELECELGSIATSLENAPLDLTAVVSLLNRARGARLSRKAAGGAARRPLAESDTDR